MVIGKGKKGSHTYSSLFSHPSVSLSHTHTHTSALPAPPQNNFERNQLDTFFLEFPREQDCGTPMDRLVIERTSSMTPNSDWHLDWIEVGQFKHAFAALWVSKQHTSSYEEGALIYLEA
jgi:hypothetical protein